MRFNRNWSEDQTAPWQLLDVTLNPKAHAINYVENVKEVFISRKAFPSYSFYASLRDDWQICETKVIRGNKRRKYANIKAWRLEANTNTLWRLNGWKCSLWEEKARKSFHLFSEFCRVCSCCQYSNDVVKINRVRVRNQSRRFHRKARVLTLRCRLPQFK